MEFQPPLAEGVLPSQEQLAAGMLTDELPWGNGFIPCFSPSVAVVLETGRCLSLLSWGTRRGQQNHIQPTLHGIEHPCPKAASCHPPVYLLGLQSFKPPCLALWQSAASNGSPVGEGEGHVCTYVTLSLQLVWKDDQDIKHQSLEAECVIFI